MIEITIAAEDPVQLLTKLRAAVQAWGTPAQHQVTANDRVEDTIASRPAEDVAAYVAPTNGHAKTKPPKEKPEKSSITAQMLREVLGQYLDTHSEAEALKILRKVGKSDNVVGIDPARYQAVYDAFAVVDA